MLRLILILNCIFTCVFTVENSPKCKPDKACITKYTKEIYKSLFEDENYELDPIHQNLIEGDFGNVKYTLTNSTITGYKKCSVKSGNLDLKNKLLEMDLYCPEFHLNGKYNMQGYLIAMPVEGNGDCIVNSKAYNLKIRMDVSLIPQGKQHHLHINNFYVDAIPLGRVVYDLKNLFNGQKYKADKLLKFINKNWILVTYELQGPVIRSNLKKIFSAANDYFKKQPIENFIQM